MPASSLLKDVAGNYSPGTINRYANMLSCIFKTAKRWNIIEDTVETPKSPAADGQGKTTCLSAPTEELPLILQHGPRLSCAAPLNYLGVNTVDIAKYLGHACCSTTINIYIHSSEAFRQTACKKLNHFIREHAWHTGNIKQVKM